MIAKEDSQLDADFLELLQRARAGDNSAFGELIQKYHKLLFAMARDGVSPELRGTDGDSDIVQDAELKAFTSFAQFRGENHDDMQRWLRTIVRSVVLDRRDYFQAEKRDCRMEQPLRSIQDDSRNPNLKGPDPTPSEFMSRQEDRERIEKAVSELPTEQREVVELRYRQYYSIPEIARMLAITHAVAEQRWYKAVCAIRKKVCPNERTNPARSR